jgi:hypothetical protein
MERLKGKGRARMGVEEGEYADGIGCGMCKGRLREEIISQAMGVFGR